MLHNPTREFIEFHRELREASERIVSMESFKGRSSVPCNCTLYYNGKEMVIDIESYDRMGSFL